MNQTNQRMWAASGPSSRRFNLHTRQGSEPGRNQGRNRARTGPEPSLPRCVGGSDEEVDDDSVTHVEAVLHGPEHTHTHTRSATRQPQSQAPPPDLM